LRKKETQAEKKLWEALRNRKLQNMKFRRQHPLSGFIADFYCHELNLVIELDGKIHLSKEIKQNDKIRQAIIEGLGLKVVRFSNDEVLYNIENVLSEISKLK
jgi:very-short-patch-repair endonuclease